MLKIITLIAFFIPTLSLAADVDVTGVWIAEAPPVSKVHAAYFQLGNTSKTGLKLVAASSEAYRSIEIHLSQERDGVASMRRVDSITVPAEGRIELEPGGYHLMLMQPIRRVVAGDRIPLTLHFEDDTSVNIVAEVKKTSVDAHQHHDHHHHDH